MQRAFQSIELYRLGDRRKGVNPGIDTRELPLQSLSRSPLMSAVPGQLQRIDVSRGKLHNRPCDRRHAAGYRLLLRRSV
jgi:hypothetical protein